MNKPFLSVGHKIVRLVIIIVIPLLVIALFVWAGGWLDTGRLTSDKLITALEKSNGNHPGYRRNHAKGVCILGDFSANGNASTLSRAALFASGVTPVVGRLAIAGGNPNAPDYAVPIRSMALAFYQKNGEQWRTGMNAMPFFPVQSVQGFYDLQTATLPDARTGKPDPARMQAFVRQHPEIKPFFAWAKQYVPSSSWVRDQFNSLNAFNFIDKEGHSHLVRWSMVPHADYQAMDEKEKDDINFLQRDLQQRLAQGPQKWDLIGWAMLSAAGYPVTLGHVVLPPIVPLSNNAYAILRPLHSLIAMALFITVMLHLAAALFHALILRNGVFRSMVGAYKRKRFMPGALENPADAE